MQRAVLAIALALFTSPVLAEEFVVLRGALLELYDTASPAAQISSVTVHDASNNPLPLSAIDYRPADGRLYGCNNSILYVIDESTGLATFVGAFTTPLTQILSFDFNPSTDQLRVYGVQVNTGKNIRVNPTTAATIATDPNFTVNGNNAGAFGLAHTNSVAGAPDGSLRLLAVYPTVTHYMVADVGSQAGGNASFNTGVMTTIGSTGIDSNSGSHSLTGFDVSPGTDICYLTYATGSGASQTSTLTTVNLSTGALTTLGTIGAPGTPTTFRIALVPPPNCPGDANNDNAVDGADLSVLLGQFGSSVTPGTGADFNNDGLVNAADLSVLLASFGSSC